MKVIYRLSFFCAHIPSRFWESSGQREREVYANNIIDMQNLYVHGRQSHQYTLISNEDRDKIYHIIILWYFVVPNLGLGVINHFYFVNIIKTLKIKKTRGLCLFMTKNAKKWLSSTIIYNFTEFSRTPNGPKVVINVSEYSLNC